MARCFTKSSPTKATPDGSLSCLAILPDRFWFSTILAKLLKSFETAAPIFVMSSFNPEPNMTLLTSNGMAFQIFEESSTFEP